MQAQNSAQLENSVQRPLFSRSTRRLKHLFHFLTGQIRTKGLRQPSSSTPADFKRMALIKHGRAMEYFESLHERLERELSTIRNSYPPLRNVKRPRLPKRRWEKTLVEIVISIYGPSYYATARRLYLHMSERDLGDLFALHQSRFVPDSYLRWAVKHKFVDTDLPSSAIWYSWDFRNFHGAATDPLEESAMQAIRNLLEQNWEWSSELKKRVVVAWILEHRCEYPGFSMRSWKNIFAYTWLHMLEHHEGLYEKPESEVEKERIAARGVLSMSTMTLCLDRPRGSGRLRLRFRAKPHIRKKWDEMEVERC